MVIRGELFARLGGLDTGFPMFCEDVDVCRRAKGLGFRVVYDPRAEIVHFIGGSRRSDPLRSEWLRHRSMSHYVLKYRGHGNPLAWALVAGVWGRFAVEALRASRT
jgi:GT2 family glycosyltransferase